ncbi:hypothetical protein RLEG12_08800 (plasmid) [Rhizobium leguminosarum bv. trifolii CB782]|nr:hypothetical protein RLEG12_08800 [Rhizobium leguminosarum bv. trifolii CB782]
MGYQGQVRMGKTRWTLKSVRQCPWKHTLHIVTLVATRGRDFALAMLSQRHALSGLWQSQGGDCLPAPSRAAALDDDGEKLKMPLFQSIKDWSPGFIHATPPRHHG